MLCSDKTGTLTLNKLTLGEIWCVLCLLLLLLLLSIDVAKTNRVADAKKTSSLRALLYSLMTIKRQEPDAIDTYFLLLVVVVVVVFFFEIKRLLCRCVLNAVDAPDNAAIINDAAKYKVVDYEPFNPDTKRYVCVCVCACVCVMCVIHSSSLCSSIPTEQRQQSSSKRSHPRSNLNGKQYCCCCCCNKTTFSL
jgi:magnesium-transporting ATPase (P-type)